MKNSLKLLGAILVAATAFNVQAKTLKVLTIGNSFSICLLKQLPQCAAAMPDCTLDLCSLYIGGCSLERHWNNVVAATNKDLRKEIENGNFREDLYYRLSVIVIKVPSLDERKDDIPLLVDYFVEQLSTEKGLLPRQFSPEAIKLLQEKSWPGNIRELCNVVERLLIFGGNPVSAEDVKMYVIPVQ